MTERSRDSAARSEDQDLLRDDAPELTDEWFESAEIRVGPRVVRRGRPPAGDRPKKQVTLRIDTDVIEAFKATGTGWQTAINDTLRRAVIRKGQKRG